MDVVAVGGGFEGGRSADFTIHWVWGQVMPLEGYTLLSKNAHSSHGFNTFLLALLKTRHVFKKLTITELNFPSRCLSSF